MPLFRIANLIKFAPMEFSGVILAGGLSSRMGTDKALITIGGVTFIERACNVVASLVREILIVTNRPERFDFLPYPKFEDVRPERCSLAGVHAGLTHARYPNAIVLACDLPFLSTDLLLELTAYAGQADAVVAESPMGVEPLCAIYHRSCLDAITSQLDRGCFKIADLLEIVRTKKVRVETHGTVSYDLLNVNTPEELEQARQRLAKGPA